ncbi:MAG TPA: hypothetical protein VNI02_14470, partial [Blastocatellia bacterium]|nr:hypothetical protein [Blastocatellia bacterium]
MPNAKDILWFKQQFHREIEAAVQGSPFSLDMLTAIACQETGHIWQVLRKRQLSTKRILELCVGDTLDSDRGRSAFPKTKSDLIAKPNGAQMFEIARQALVDVSQFITSLQAVAARPNKFCHGFGIFQYDLQFFLTDPDYFLQKRYADLDACIGKCIGELRNAMKRIGFQGKTTLTDFEMAAVAIAYNTGNFKPSKGLKQGFFNGTKFYGEEFFDFLRLSKTIALEGESPAPLSPPSPGTAIVPPPSPVEATGTLFEVDVRQDPLRLRSEPKVDANNPNSNVIARLPDGHIVQAVTNKRVNGFLEVETSLLGAHHRGFASAQFLKSTSSVDAVPVLAPASAPPSSSIVAVFMPRKQGAVTKRTESATPHSLNEPNQPSRKSSTPDELRAELAAIINWLAVDKKTHLRYQPRPKTTFCNIYAHDYCHLAGVYLPRVWWTPGAIEALAQGHSVQPLFGKTIDEQRANDLFRWLRDFGLRFGWRQTGTLSKLQLEVNQGAVGLMVARRRADGLSGHIVVVVPETDEH